MNDFALEVAQGKRFEFGKNWSRFLATLNDERIAEAEKSLQTRLEVSDLRGKRFLDIGSGSGLFSLAARRLGARVHSLDYDPQSVACTAELQQRYFPEDADWTVEQGSALDAGYLRRLGTFDVVYSWGVLHHTGAMWEALDNASLPVRPGGYLFIAIYNYQPLFSRYWTLVKRLYNRNLLLRYGLIVIHWPYLFGLRFVARALTGRLKLERGMSLWHDMLDWLGGYPFEVARPEEIVAFYRKKGYTLTQLKTCGGRSGCNEFVFERRGAESP